MKISASLVVYLKQLFTYLTTNTLSTPNQLGHLQIYHHLFLIL